MTPEAALQQEYVNIIASLSSRAALLAARVAELEARLVEQAASMKEESGDSSK